MGLYNILGALEELYISISTTCLQFPDHLILIEISRYYTTLFRSISSYDFMQGSFRICKFIQILKISPN